MGGARNERLPLWKAGAEWRRAHSPSPCGIAAVTANFKCRWSILNKLRSKKIFSINYVRKKKKIKKSSVFSPQPFRD